MVCQVRTAPIGPEHAEDAIAVFVAAFMKESATNYFFPEAEGERPEKLRTLFEWGVRYRLACDMPVLAAWQGDVLAGAALVRSPAWRQDPPLAQKMWEDSAAKLGPIANARIELYDQVQARNLPDPAHAYLVAIGVHPDLQGQGIGAALIEACIEIAESDPIAEGMALDTGSELSQAYYERFGFRLHAVDRMEEQVMRIMYRPNVVVSSPP